MKALVTGAGGYTGSYLLPYLQSQKVRIEAITTKTLPIARCHSVDWKNPKALTSLLKLVRPDFIFHLVGTREKRNLSELINVNALYASNLFEAIGESGVFVPTLVMGSAAEYGNVLSNALPISEATPANPITEYGLSKYVQTLIAQQAIERGIPVINARVFNLIGPQMPNTLMLGKFCEQLQQVMQGIRSRIEMGNTQSVRDLIDVNDVVEIFWKLVQEPRAIGKTINICTGRAVKVREIITSLRSLCKVTAEIQTDDSILKRTDLQEVYGSPATLIGLVGKFQFTHHDVTLQSIAENLCAFKESKIYANG